MRRKLNKYFRNIFHFLVWQAGRLSRLGRIKGESNTILIIRNDALGDFVLSISLLKFLRDKYCKKKIVFIVEKVAYEMAIAMGYADEVICFDKKKCRKSVVFKMRFLLSLRKYAFELVINPLYARDRFSDEIVLYSNALSVIGWNNPSAPNLSPIQKRRGDKLYTTLFDPDFFGLAHQLIVNSRLIELLGGEPKHYPVVDGTSNRAICRNYEDIQIAIFTDAGFRQREWETEKYDSLTQTILENFPTIKILLLGARKEVSKTQINNRVVDKRGSTTIIEAVDLVKQCSLVIGNETGPLHISALLGIDTICILGGGHYGEFFPYPAEYNPNNHVVCINYEMPCYHCNWSCEYMSFSENTYPCISTITVDQVFAAVSTKLLKLRCSARTADAV